MTPVPTTVEELNKLSRWTVYMMSMGGKFKDSSEEIRKEVKQIVEGCRESL